MAFQQSGTGFTNLKKVVDANQDNGLGTTIQNGITNQADSTKSNLNSSFGQFQNDVNNNAVDTAANRDQVTNTVNKFGGGDTQQIDLGKGGFDEHAAQPGQPTTPGPYGAPTDSTGGTVTGASTDLSNQTPPATQTAAPTLNGGDISAFQKFRSGSYSGPQQIGNIGDIQNQAQDAQQLGQSVNNAGGRQALLQRFIGGNQYTQGQQGLDNLLLGATGAPNLQAAQQSTRGIVNQVNQADSNAKALANQTASQNRSFADFTNQSIANVYDPQSAQLDTNVAGTQATETAREAKIKALTDMLSKDNTSDTAKAALKQLSDMGLISNARPDQVENVDPTAGLSYDSGGNQFQPLKVYRDKDGEYLNEQPNGSLMYSGGPKGGQIYHPPGVSYNQGDIAGLNPIGGDGRGNQYMMSNDGKTSYVVNASGQIIDERDPATGKSIGAAPSELDQWNTLIGNLDKFNEKAPERVNYNNILQQAIGDTQAQNVNRTGLANSQQASRLNALNQLAGRSQEFADPNAVGTYAGGSQNFNQAQALKAIKAITDPKGAAADAAAEEERNKGFNPLGGVNDAVGDLVHGGNVGRAAGDIVNLRGLASIVGTNNAVGKGLTGAQDAITNVGQGVQNRVDELFGGGGGGGGGRWFCTELYRRRLCTASEVFGMSKFLLRNVFSFTKPLLFYAENGEQIVKVANKHNFNWAAQKEVLVDRVLEMTSQGRHKEAFIHYAKIVQEMCLKFEETKHLYHDDLWNTSWTEMVILLPRLVRTKSFKMACKLFFAGMTGKLKPRKVRANVTGNPS